jgi:hypothetical protein
MIPWMHWSSTWIILTMFFIVGQWGQNIVELDDLYRVNQERVCVCYQGVNCLWTNMEGVISSSTKASFILGGKFWCLIWCLKLLPTWKVGGYFYLYSIFIDSIWLYNPISCGWKFSTMSCIIQVLFLTKFSRVLH